MTRPRSLVPVGELVGALVPPSAGGTSLVPISRAWASVVGPVIARESWPARIGADGTLHVHVTSSLWVSELTLLGADILGRLVAAVSVTGVSSVSFRVGTVPVAPVRREAPPPPVTSPAAIAAARELASVIADPALREAARRAIERAIVRSISTPDSG